MSCATCHDPNQRATAQSNSLAVQPGGPECRRARVSLGAVACATLNTDPAFSFDDEGTPNGGPQPRRPGQGSAGAGGCDPCSRRTRWQTHHRPIWWRHASRRRPTPRVPAGVRRRTCSPTSEGDGAPWSLFALANSRAKTPDFRPFDPKYDLLPAPARVRAPPRAELRGLTLFNRSTRQLHRLPSERPRSGPEPPMFTDFTYDNLGVPRNEEIPATVDSDYREHGAVRPIDPTWPSAGTSAVPSRCPRRAKSPRARCSSTTAGSSR